jgi:thioredoxin 1
MSRIRRLNDEDLLRILDFPNSIAIAFMRYTSIPCANFLPELMAMPEVMKDRLKFFYLDVDENPDITERMGVTAIPTLLVIRRKEEVARYEGPYSRDALRQRLDAVLSKGA